MIFTNGELFESIQTLQACREQNKLGYAIAKNLRLLLTEGKEYLEARDAAIQKYGTPDSENFGKFNFTPEQAQHLQDDIGWMANEKTADIPIYQIPEEVFTSGSLTSQQMYALDWMVKRDE